MISISKIVAKNHVVWPHCSSGVTGVSVRGRVVSVCVSPEGWAVCFNDVCSCNIER